LRKTILATLLLLLVAGMAGVVSANAECVLPAGLEPYTDLLAGQDMDVGEVYVWNDADTLYVYYDVTLEDWYLTETHLAVECDEAGVPQTKKGNPIPGQFEYGDCFDQEEMRTSACYTVPIPDCNGDELCGETPVIAAHAVVRYFETGTITPDLAWQRSAEPASAAYAGYGAAWELTDGFDIPLCATQTVWDNGVYYNNSVPAGREWASWEYAYNNGGSFDDYSDLRRFQATFTVPDGYEVTAGSLYAPDYTAGIPINDNVYIFVNEDLLFWGGTRVNQITDGMFQSMAGIQALRGESEPVETDRWYIPGTIPEVTSFVSGANTIDVFTEENERWGGMGKLVLELDYEYTYTETAWGDGDRFVDKGNWGMYSTYDGQCCPEILLENGGFEAPDVADNNWAIFASGTEDLGWTVEWFGGSESFGGYNRPAIALLEIHDDVVGGVGINAYEGNQYAELDTDWGVASNEPASVRIYQDVCTYPGAEYSLEYAWKARNSNSMMKVYWDGTQVDGTYSGTSSDWNDESESVYASGWETRLEFIETGIPDSLGMFLDDVSVELAE
jgi:hypothetical protein